MNRISRLARIPLTLLRKSHASSRTVSICLSQ